MKKIIVALTLVGALSMGKISMYSSNNDSPNEKVNYKKTQVKQSEDTSETAIFVEDITTPKCKCEDGKCPKENRNDKDKNLKENKDDNKESGEKKLLPIED